MALIKQGICKIKSLNEDGLGLCDDKDLRLPYVLPGEEVEFEIHEYRGKKNSILRNIIKASDKRKNPDCKYFTSCGGCLLQHMNEESYIEFKISMLKNLIDKKFHHIISDPIIIGPNVRRRCVFGVLKKDGQIFLGFHRFHSHQIVNIDACPLLLPEISDFIPILKEELSQKLPEKFKSELSIVKTIEGISWYINSEIHNWPKSHILIDNVPVEISETSFLQASGLADLILQNLVMEELTDNQKLGIDLFCGRGTFTIPLSRKFKMTGLDIESQGIEALNNASKKYGLNIQAMARDLFFEPIPSTQLKKFEFAVINPPRAGAPAQIREIGKSGIKKVIYVSCNPKTFASDFDILKKFGYQITKITPVDQFHWSSHFEIVVVLELVESK
jgi:23S rRNA (uracil1939-C5)-methyltransferase